ncbi:hypothetical protein FEM33_13790 [Dyadobacter flavalbus]|uniref:Uncharacterized protein n=1 Tax=Dyadobacter flavalbus TaxID=2579942 RepID=A0A5M8QY40_9BACT|nr:hypothetical protein FEM33_13790 [Dyadobacter flavalbus]
MKSRNSSVYSQMEAAPQSKSPDLKRSSTLYIYRPGTILPWHSCKRQALTHENFPAKSRQENQCKPII